MRMKTRFVIVIIVAISLHLTAWYYVTAFCAIYTKSSVSWINGGFTSLIISIMVVQTVKPIVHVIIRFFAKKFPFNK